MMALLSQTTMPSSSMVGILAFGFRARNAGAVDAVVSDAQFADRPHHLLHVD
jgi:hypothetical protein